MIQRKYIHDILLRFKQFYNGPPQKLLYEHIPKCGGTSVTQYIKSQYIHNRTFSISGARPHQDINYFKSLPKRQRYRYDLVIGHNAHDLTGYVSPEVLKATVFREPIDRIISWYYYVLRTPEHYLYKEVVGQKMTLEQIVSADLTHELRNYYVSMFLDIPASEAERTPKTSIESAYRLITGEYTIIGTLDNLDATMDRLRIKANLYEEFRNEKRNVTTNRPRVIDIEDSTVQIVKEYNFLDIELYHMIKNTTVSLYK